MSQNTYVALSHAILGCTSLCCLGKIGFSLNYPQLAFGCISFHSFLGAIEFGVEENNTVLHTMYDISKDAICCFSICPIVSYMFQFAKYSDEFCTIPTIAATVPLTFRLSGEKLSLKFEQEIVCTNAFLLGVESYEYGFVSGITAAICYLVGFLGFRKSEPNYYIFNYSLCLYVLLSTVLVVKTATGVCIHNY